jgi:hypothetical protein
MAFIAAHSCKLHAIAVQDRVFTNDTYTEPRYKWRREQVFTVASTAAMQVERGSMYL